MGESGELEVSVEVMVVASVFERIHFVRFFLLVFFSFFLFSSFFSPWHFILSTNPHHSLYLFRSLPW